MSLVINSLGGRDTRTHTRTPTSQTKETWHVPGLIKDK